MALQVQAQTFAYELIQFIVYFRLIDLEVQDHFCTFRINSVSLT